MISRRVVLHFPSELIDQPIISNTVKRYNLEFNILKASIAPPEGGLLVVELQGGKKDVQEALDYLKDLHIKIDNLSRDITRKDDFCVHCGVCVAICPSDALVLNITKGEVDFLPEKCVACELCVKACPYAAMEVRL
ncbi:MAG: 4Fe-4S binding protein [Deltaproteobacteria bacterium]|nr:4Fe-4S binding protein [Deltaproteobacteria bacterium]